MKSHLDLPKIPVALNFATTDEAKKLFQTGMRVHGPSVLPMS